MADLQKREMIRRVRLGNVRTLVTHRCGHLLPEDDAGQEYLIEMLKIISLGPDPGRKMCNAIEVFAPWMTGIDCEQVIGHVNRMPAWERWPKAKILGESLRLTNDERERFGLWAIHPCDISDEDLAEQRKRKERERKRLKRGKSRSAYLTEVASKQPWIEAGMSRRTWFRHQAKKRMALGASRQLPNVALGPSATKS